jgi:hypothetical protein
MCLYYEKEYQSATANYDIYALFMEKSFHLINSKGIVSFILPHKFLVSDFGVGIRKFFREKTAVDKLVHFGSEIVFQEAATYTCIIDLTKISKEKVRFKKINPKDIFEYFVWDEMSYENLNSTNWDLQNEKVFDVIEKLKTQPFTVENVFDKIVQGIATSLDEIYVFEGTLVGNFIKGYNKKYDYHFEIEKEMVKPIFGGRDIFKYQTPDIKNYIVFPYWIIENKAKQMSFEEISTNYPLATNYFKKYEDVLRGREKGRFNNDLEWFLFSRKQGINGIELPKIMTREISLGCNMTYDNEGEYYHNTKVYSFVKNKKFDVDEKYYLGILNSKVMWFFLKNTGSEYGGGYYVFKTNYLKPFPLPEISKNAQLIIDCVNQQLKNNKDFQEQTQKFLTLLQSYFNIENPTKKIENWYKLSWSEFEKELNKLKIILLSTQKEDWFDRFNRLKTQALDLQNKISQTDKGIDTMVYELYGLNEEEIAVVEAS